MKRRQADSMFSKATFVNLLLTILCDRAGLKTTVTMLLIKSCCMVTALYNQRLFHILYCILTIPYEHIAIPGPLLELVHIPTGRYAKKQFHSISV
jgi:hypothetical protein